jgi:hypothetical protein
MATNPLVSVASRQYTLPEWARQSGSAVDLRKSPFWRAQDNGSGSGTLGSGDGSGFYGPLNQFAGQQVGSGDGQYGTAPDIQGAIDWLGGNQLMQAYGGDSEIARWIQDSQGNITAAPEITRNEDSKFWTGAKLAAAVTGANLYGAGAAGGSTASGGGAAADAGIKTIGTIAPGSAPVGSIALTAGEAALPALGAIPAAPTAAIGGGLAAAGAAGGVAPTVAGGGAGGSIIDAVKAAGGNMDWSDWAKLGTTLIGSGIQANAAGKAVDAQAQSTNAAIAEQRRQFDLQRSDSAAYRDAGVNALSQFQTLNNTPTTAADVMQDPGYQFGLDQGQQAIDRKVAAMGGRVSGQAIKAAGRFGTNYATTGYTAADQRRNDRLNRLASLAGIGQSATNASAAAGSAMANNISGLVTGQGNAAGGGIMARGNIWANTANQLAALYGRSNQPNQAPASSGWAGGGWGSGNGWGNQDMGIEYGG